ncbi:hypothetical protein K227x_38910 [Rubripirellula lacrimiformis]|uniref:Hemin uptake protein hemP n=1 Tax=Rubripirellula lacrimiformis TaxID=1930273 RepID=A0A517NEE0_9BACT|nr:hemin uptake protein HemP [Rubripirellula lacrimiformis]QDT05491.1 hypothetical protein K227x_38910 [Rubripirellula lacrimiformis]
MNTSEESSESDQAGAPVNPSWQHPLGSKVIRFTDLARCGQEIWIEHEGQLYRLRQTRHGKLVLTK